MADEEPKISEEYLNLELLKANPRTNSMLAHMLVFDIVGLKFGVDPIGQLTEEQGELHKRLWKIGNFQELKDYCAKHDLPFPEESIIIERARFMTSLFRPKTPKI